MFKIKHTVNQNTKSLTMTPTSFLKETCLTIDLYIVGKWLIHGKKHHTDNL